MNDYLGLFVNRRAYTMQSMRPHPESRRHYLFQAHQEEFTGTAGSDQRDYPAAS